MFALALALVIYQELVWSAESDSPIILGDLLYLYVPIKTEDLLDKCQSLRSCSAVWQPILEC